MIKQLNMTRMFGLGVLLMLMGCVPQMDFGTRNGAPFNCPNTPIGIRIHEFEFKCYHAGKSYENRPIECIVVGAGSDTILFLAAMHGDEKAGSELVRKLAQHLTKYPKILEGRRVVILPAVNPDGILRKSRYNARGVDLNRNFDTSNRINSLRYGMEPESEPETRLLIQIIQEYRPSRIISVHTPLGCVDYDGPAESLARHLSEMSHLPVRKIGEHPGSLGSYAGIKLGIPTITLELGEDAEQLDAERLWNRYGFSLVAVIFWKVPSTPL